MLGYRVPVGATTTLIQERSPSIGQSHRAMKSGAIQTDIDRLSLLQALILPFSIQTDTWATGDNKEKDDDRSNFDCTSALFQ